MKLAESQFAQPRRIEIERYRQARRLAADQLDRIRASDTPLPPAPRAAEPAAETPPGEAAPTYDPWRALAERMGRA